MQIDVNTPEGALALMEHHLNEAPMTAEHSAYRAIAIQTMRSLVHPATETDNEDTK